MSRRTSLTDRERAKKVPLLVTDHGSSFMARRFQEHIRGLFRHVRIAFRTPTQLGLPERFDQTLKSEEVHWRLYDSLGHARACLDEFRQRYNRVAAPLSTGSGTWW